MKISKTRYSFILVLPVLLAVMQANGTELRIVEIPSGQTDARPPVECVIHNIGNIGMAIFNIGLWGDTDGNYPSFEWPSGSLSNYLYSGDLWSCCYGEVTSAGIADNPLPSGDPDNIFYHYNYIGADGIPDNDVDQNGVSDHFTILARVTGSDTLYRQDPESGVILFSEGMPFYHFEHTVGDTTYLVVPRNLSYMWDSDSPGSSEDDSGEPLLPVMCNG